MALYLRILALMFNVWLLDSQGVPQLACRYFEYRSDVNGIYGYIEFNINNQVTSVFTIVNITVAAQLPSSYVGDLEYLGMQLHNGIATVRYKVIFPLSQPVPKITSIVVNNNYLCSGQEDSLRPGAYVTSISLHHRVTLPSSFNTDTDTYRPTLSTTFNGIRPSSEAWEDMFSRPQRPSNPENRYPQPSPQQPVTLPPPPPTRAPPAPPPPPPPPVYTEPVYVEPTQNVSRPVQPTTPMPTPASSNNEECGLVAGAAPLIYNGDSYERGEWPWLVAIYRRKDGTLSFICGGSLVSDMHVVTAAHCMQQKSTYSENKDIVIRVGVFNLEDWSDDTTVTRTLSSARIHESYNAVTLANDILVLTFNKKVTFSNYIRPICLWTGSNDLEKVVGKKGVVAGWGKSEFGPSGKGDPRAVRIPIVSTTTCRNSRPDFHSLTSSYTLCAGGLDGSGPCFGDSGGGLYVHEGGRWRLRGIVSLSLRPDDGDYNCNLKEYVVFTDAAQYLPWIQEKIDVKR